MATLSELSDRLKHSGEGAPVGDGMPVSGIHADHPQKQGAGVSCVVAIPGLNALQSPKPPSAMDAG